MVHVGGAMWWLRRETSWDRYFRRPSAERRELRDRVRARARFVTPIFAALARLFRLPMARTRFRGVSFSIVCTRKTLERAAAYTPDARDVFVATQMKCGTTWMQQIVYEVLCRGDGDLGDAGHRHLYAISPWIESTGAVRLEDAPYLGDPPRRIVKTHFSADLCPFSESARYIYVARDPVACFASCVDFLGFLIGPLAPDAEGFLDWFCSDDMYWGPWPDHVEGWWRLAEAQPNVLFLHYEAMLDDLGAAVDRVAAHLDVVLTPDQRARVVERSGYDYMKSHEERFEMAAPGYFEAAGGTFFVSGGRDRGRDVAAQGRTRIHAFVRERMADAHYPLARFYPDVVDRVDLVDRVDVVDRVDLVDGGDS